MDNETTNVIKYKSLTGQDITLSPAIIRKYLVHGEGKVSDQEVMMFLALCKYQSLNPFLREAYLVKYGSEPATIVTGKETFLKRAVKNANYQGHKTGISDNCKTAWAEVYVKGYQIPIRCEVDYDEYVGRKKDGTINRIWKEKPRTMLKKVALVQALREAFPEDFGGMYSPEEINSIQTELLPTSEIVIRDDDGRGGVEPDGEGQGVEEDPTNPSYRPPSPPPAESIVITTMIDGVTKKEGKKKDGKNYTIYNIIVGDNKISTFSKTMAQTAKEIKEKDLAAYIEYQKTERGLGLVSIKPVEEPNE